MIKRIHFVLVISIVMVSVSFSLNAQRIVKLGTGSPAGMYFLMGGALSQIFNEATDDIKIVTAVTAGARQNIDDVATGKLQIGLASAHLVEDSMTGKSYWKKNPHPNLRILAGLHPEYSIFAIADDVNLSNVAELGKSGAKIVALQQGSGQAHLLEDVLEHLDTKEDPMRPTLAEAVQLVEDRKLDGYFFSVGFPLRSFSVRATRSMSIISISGPKFDEFISAHYTYERIEIPVGPYTNFTNPAPVPGYMQRAVIFTQENASEDQIYLYVKLLHENLKKVAALHPAFKDLAQLSPIKVEGIRNKLFHPGALRYYKEVGLI